MIEAYRIHLADALLKPENRMHLLEWLVRCESAKDLEELKPFNPRAVWAALDTEFDFIINLILKHNPDVDALAAIVGLDDFAGFKAGKKEAGEAERAERMRDEQQDAMDH